MANTCPYCGVLTAVPGPCPTCGSGLIPTQPHQPAVYMQQPASPPVIVVHQESPRFRKSRNWFTQAFTATMGVAAVVLVASALFVGGIVWLGSHGAVAHAELMRSARNMSAIPLRKVGILELSANATVERSSNRVVFIATGRDRYAEMHPVTVHFYVAQFRGTEQWKCEYVTVDGRVVE